MEEEKVEKPTKEVTVTRRRGRRLRKGKCRRGSGYGQQTEVRDLFEPTDTQISHIGDGSRRTSLVMILYYNILIPTFFIYTFHLYFSFLIEFIQTTRM